MYVKRKYGFWMTFYWSKMPFIWGMVYAGVLSILYQLANIHIFLPWEPIGVIGIAVAFYLGFKNNSSYDRTWEARKIWGGIVNNSRSFGSAVISFVKGENDKELHKELIHRHIAWLTALRYQLRLSREWEHIQNRLNGLYAPTVCEDYYNKLDDELEAFLSKDEMNSYKDKANIATQILASQAKRLQALCDAGYFDDFRHMEFFQLVRSFYDDQGKSERIKNFPFPRQYASIALWLTVVFSALLPFGMLDIFQQSTGWIFWTNPFITGLVIWVFFLMEKIGDYSENPFEGTYNDVPITAISRGIEIDLKEMINDNPIPEPIAPERGFLL